MFKAVLFDLDGVLIDSEAFSSQASDEVLADVGIFLTEAERKQVFGRRTFDNYERHITSRGLDVDARKMVSEKNHRFKKLIHGKLKRLSGVSELLALLDSLGVHKAVVSSSPLERVNASLEEVHLLSEFELVVSGDCCEHGKPHPEPFLIAADYFNVEPRDCLVVEDAQAGVEAGKAAGMVVLAVESPSTHGQDLTQADAHVPSLVAVNRDFLGKLHQ